MATKDANTGETMSKYAKIVYSFDLQKEIDRTDITINPHRFGLFDIDFKVESANNPKARQWTYGGTKKTQEQAHNFIEKQMKKELPFDTEYRIVNSETGEIIDGDKMSNNEGEKQEETHGKIVHEKTEIGIRGLFIIFLTIDLFLASVYLIQLICGWR